MFIQGSSYHVHVCTVSAFLSLWEHSGSMVSALDSGLSGVGSAPGQGTGSLSTQVSEWVLANLILVWE